MPARRLTAAILVSFALLVAILTPITSYAAPQPETAATVAPAERGKSKVTLKLAEKRIEATEVVHATVVTPSRYTGSTVVIERKVGRKWKKLASSTAKKSGKTTFRVDGPARDGKWKLRAGVKPRGAPRHSKPVSLTIKSDPLVVADTTRVLPEGIGTSPATSYDSAAGELTLPVTGATENLVTGDTVVLPPGTGFDTGLLRRISNITPGPDGTVVLETTQASLAEAFESIPASQTIDLDQYKLTLSGLPSWVACENCRQTHRRATGPAARRDEPTFEIEEDIIDLSFDKEVPVGGSTIDFEGHLEVSAVAEMDVDVDVDYSFTKLPEAKVTDWYVEGGIEYETSLSATWAESASTDFGEDGRLELGDVEAKWKGAVGVVPIWVDLTGTLFLDFDASGDVRIVVGITSTGGLMGGLRRAAEGSPDAYFEQPRTLDVTREVNAAGSARAALGVEAAVDFYSIGGPRVEAGWQAQAEIEAGIRDGEDEPFLTCDLSHGPFVNVSLALNDDLAGALSIEKSSVDLWNSDFPQNPLLACPDGTNPPVISTFTLKEAEVGEFYLEQLGLTDVEDRDGVWTATGLPDGLTMQEVGSIVGTPVEGAGGTYDVTVLFVDEKNRSVRKTFQLVVQSASASMVITDPEGDASNHDIVDVLAKGATTDQGSGSIKVRFAKNLDAGAWMPGLRIAFDTDADRYTDYALEASIYRGRLGWGVRKYSDAPAFDEAPELRDCFSVDWPHNSLTALVAYDGACLKDNTTADFRSVRLRLETFRTAYDSGQFTPEDNVPDLSDGADPGWHPQHFVMIPGEPGTDPDPGTVSNVEFDDPEGDQQSDLNGNLDLARVSVQGASASGSGRIDLDFFNIVERGGSSNLYNVLDLDADGSADFIINASRRHEVVNANAYRGSVDNSNLMPGLRECFTFSWPGPDFRATLTFDGGCVKTKTGRDFSSVRLRVEARRGVDGIAGTTLQDQAPDGGAWSPAFAMID